MQLSLLLFDFETVLIVLMALSSGYPVCWRFIPRWLCKARAFTTILSLYPCYNFQGYENLSLLRILNVMKM